jgi:hypothetical protein
MRIGNFAKTFAVVALAGSCGKTPTIKEQYVYGVSNRVFPTVERVFNLANKEEIEKQGDHFVKDLAITAEEQKKDITKGLFSKIKEEPGNRGIIEIPADKTLPFMHEGDFITTEADEAADVYCKTNAYKGWNSSQHPFIEVKPLFTDVTKVNDTYLVGFDCMGNRSNGYKINNAFGEKTTD